MEKLLKKPAKPPLVALDTNVLIDLAQDEEAAWECLEALLSRKVRPQIVVTPTAMQELVHIAHAGETKQDRSDCAKALRSLVGWGIQPLNFLPVGHGIVERIGDELRRAGLVPEDEKHDSYIIAEAALSDADILVSADSHIHGIDHQRLHLLLSRHDVRTVLITWPRRVVRLLGGN